MVEWFLTVVRWGSHGLNLSVGEVECKPLPIKPPEFARMPPLSFWPCTVAEFGLEKEIVGLICGSFVMAPHAVVIPHPLQGQITPLFHLSEKLAAKGILVTFVNTQYNHLKIMKAHISYEITLDPTFSIRLAQISDNLPLDFDRSVHPSGYSEAINNMGPALEELIHELNTKTDPPISSIIASSFLTWTSDVANKFGLQWVLFWSQPVTCFAIYNHLSDIVSNGHFPPKKTEDIIDYIPGLPPLEPKYLPSHIQDGDSTSDMHQTLSTQFELVSRADWVIGNTVDDLESEAFQKCSPRGISRENKRSRPGGSMVFTGVDLITSYNRWVLHPWWM
eukprot:Gb_12020 [translate_table: standard]